MSNFSKISINGSFPVDPLLLPTYASTANSALRVQFEKFNNSSSPFTSAKFVILIANEIKVFAGVFTLLDGTQSTIIQIPLLGQSIQDLVDKLNTYADISAETVNSGGFISSDLLKDTSLSDATNKWLYFEASSIEENATFSTLIQQLKLFRTSAEPISIQNNLVQCLGGYACLNPIYNFALLSSPASIYDNTMYIDPLSFSESITINDLNQSRLLQINDEIVEVNKWEGFTVYLTQRNMFGTPLRFHPKNSVVRTLSKNDLFDSNFSTDGKQYRCIALANTNQTEIAKNVKVFFSLPSRNNLSGMRLAIETPKSDPYKGEVTSGGITSFSDAGLVNAFEANHYASAPIYFTSGNNEKQIRIITSYSPATGTLVLDSRLPFDISVGDSFYIDASPAQFAKSGMKKPTSPPASEFFNATEELNAVSINVSNNRLSGNDLKPNEVIYIWIERSISESNDEFLNNSSILGVVFSKV